MGIIRKAIFTGIGLVLLAKDEVQKAQHNKKMAGQDSEEYLRNLEETVDRLQDRMEAHVIQSVKDMLDRLDVVAGEELETLRKEIGELKDAIDRKDQVNR